MNLKKYIIFVSVGYFLLSLVLSFYLYSHNLLLIINADATGWFNLATQFYQRSDLSQFISWPPLYYIFLSLFFIFPHSQLVISIIQTVFFMIILYFIYRLIKNQTKSLSIFSIILIGVYALIPSHVIISKILVADTLFLVCYISHLFLLAKFLRHQNSFLLYFSFFLHIITTFIKPTLLFLPILEIPLIIYLLKETISHKKIMGILFIGLVIPSFFYLSWSYRNYLNTGVFSFANISNYNLYYHNYYHLYPYLDPNDAFPPFSEFKIESSEAIRTQLKLSASDLISGYYHLTSNQQIAQSGELAQKLLFQNILYYIPLHMFKGLILFSPNNHQVLLPFGLIPNPVIIGVDLLLGILFFGLFLIYLVKFIKHVKKISQKERLSLPLLLLINVAYFYMVIGPTGFDDGGRFSMVFLCLVFVFIASIKERPNDWEKSKS